MPGPPPGAPTPACTATCIFDHPAEEDDELTMQVGDSILVMEKDAEGWWMGQNTRTGASGLFPYNYVKENM